MPREVEPATIWLDSERESRRAAALTSEPMRAVPLPAIFRRRFISALFEIPRLYLDLVDMKMGPMMLRGIGPRACHVGPAPDCRVKKPRPCGI